MLILWPIVADIISTVEFDQSGNYLATGDKGGRVVLFERNESVSVCGKAVVTLADYLLRKKPVNTNFTQNSSHTNQSSTILNPSKLKKR